VLPELMQTGPKKKIQDHALMILIMNHQCMVMNNLKLINAQHPNITHAYKNKKKLHITNAAIWVNEEKKCISRKSHNQPFNFHLAAWADRLSTGLIHTISKPILNRCCKPTVHSK
jgi:hypothetical protein